MPTAHHRRFAVVTGGSSGIGFELARLFIANGFDVIVGSLKTKLTGMANDVLPERTKARQHAKMAEPGSGRKQ